MSNGNRVTEIYALPEAEGRSALAGFLAMQTNYTKNEARQILSAAPRSLSAENQSNGDDGASEIVSLAKSLGLKGFATGPTNRGGI